MWLDIDPNLKEEFPGLKAYKVRIMNVRTENKEPSVTRGLDELLNYVERDVKQKYTLENLKDFAIIRSYRDFFWRVGIDPTKIRPASEALIRRILSDKPFPRINNLVDSYNLASVVSSVPIAAFDMDKLVGNLQMRKSRSEEIFLGIGMVEAQKLTGAEVVVSDSEKLIAIYPYRDAAMSRITATTKNVLLLICGVPNVDDRILDESKRITIELVTRFCGGIAIYE
ncbi:MAG: phenylalanine--tRNA ligase beta subunit-related protein [Nitrososphaeria archaeon]